MKFCAELLLVTELAQEKKKACYAMETKNSCCTNEPKVYAAVASKS